MLPTTMPHNCIGCDAPVLQVLYIQSLNDTQRLMVVDEKLKILHCSNTLAKMLGTTTSALSSMALPALIAPPAAQLHKRWITVGRSNLRVAGSNTTAM